MFLLKLKVTKTNVSNFALTFNPTYDKKFGDICYK